MKIVFDIKIEIGIYKYQMCQISKILSNFNIETNLGLIGGKYLIKIICDVKIEIGMLSFFI